ncbi:Protein of unknown function (DUF1826) [Methylophaga frappieri]|uniref:Succinylglutamate desuccinylase n=1 Tax=Methylophaga frappieri (strain ATCC BAA-2434 / DSM 25690 / JAM7) TaxID=754477 RepID=I1YL22_METFJ|nr:DUF1826 domain-containing protein [Methylophaga frappieri]AFJ03615.1 Protein of unknown function (DUF1826) [Methylophaga frappieri]
MLASTCRTLDVYPQTTQINRLVDLTEIYRPEVNLVQWLREPDARFEIDIKSLLSRPALAIRQQVSSNITLMSLGNYLRLPSESLLLFDIQRLISLFADLFDLHEVGLRLEKIGATMCPRFHTDKLACRLVTAYHGVGTQWLDENNIDRCKLGAGAAGLPDSQSGIYQFENQIRTANTSDVLLLKGDSWPESPVAGIVHRSPPACPNQPRLLLTLDFAD